MPRGSETETDDTLGTDDEYELEGNLKTSLVWDASKKHLSVNLRQFVQTNFQTEIKYKGMLNTVTGEHRMTGQLFKTFQTNMLSLQKVYTAARLQTLRQKLVAEGPGKNQQLLQQVSSQIRTLKVDPNAFLPGGVRPLILTDWCIAPGLTYVSDRSNGLGLRPALLIKKAPQLLIHSPRTDLMLSAKLLTDFEPGTNKVSTGAGLRLKLFKFNVTTKQDLKVSVGLDLSTSPLDTSTVAPGRSWSRTPYLKISENNTSIRLQGGKWTFQYTL